MLLLVVSRAVNTNASPLTAIAAAAGSPLKKAAAEASALRSQDVPHIQSILSDLSIPWRKLLENVQNRRSGRTQQLVPAGDKSGRAHAEADH